MPFINRGYKVMMPILKPYEAADSASIAFQKAIEYTIASIDAPSMVKGGSEKTTLLRETRYTKE